MAGTVLLVEDESSIADNVLYALRTEGFTAHWTSLGEEALARLRDAGGSPGAIDLVILDIGLPDGNGVEVCKAIRGFSQVPIVFLTSRADEIDKVVGLEIGADDYVVKPFSPRELVARVKAILKRTRPAPPPAALGVVSAGVVAPTAAGATTTPAVTQHGPFLVDSARATISYAGVPLALTRYELLLLRFLIAHPDQVFSRGQLLDRVWDAAQTSLERTVDAHVKSLRAKLRGITPDQDPIRTHRGLGYSLSP